MLCARNFDTGIRIKALISVVLDIQTNGDMSNKKITRVGDESAGSSGNGGTTFVPTPESKAKAKKLRLFAWLAFIVAIAIQLYLIFGVLLNPPINMTILLIGIGINLIPALTGSYLWKKANRLDPASEKNPTKFFIQNQLGAIMGVLAFLPLVILIFLNKDMSGKQKGLAGGVAIIALLVAGISGVDFNPPSVEQYTEQTQRVERLNNGQNLVYWTKAGTRYHLYSDCSYINTNRTDEIFEGTVAQARELKNITELCSRCEANAMEAGNLNEQDLLDPVEEPALNE